MANIQKRGKSYRFTAYSGYDVNGKQIRRTKTWTPPPTMTPKQIEKAVQREAVLFDEQVQSGLFLDGNITLKEFSEKWITDYAEKQLKAKTLNGYKDILPRILQSLGHMKLSKIQPHHLQEFYNNLAEGGVRLDTKYKAAVMLVLYTGMRRGELCGLNWSDIDLKDGIVHIQRELLYTPSKGIYEDSTKTKQSNRVIQIPDDMIRLLTDYRREQLTRRLELGSKWIETDKVFTSDCGGYIRPDTLTAWFQKFIKRSDLPPEIHLHSHRHTSATLLIAGGVDIATVSKRLGHADKSTTLNVYTHAIQSADARAAEKLQDILNPMKRYSKTGNF